MLLFPAFKDGADGGSVSHSRTLWLDTGLMDTSAVYTVQARELCYLLPTEWKTRCRFHARHTLWSTPHLLLSPPPCSLPPRVAFTEHRATEPTRLLVHSAGDSIHHAARYHGFHYWNAFCVRSHKNDALNFKEEINNKRLSIEIWRGKRASARPEMDGVTCMICTVLLCSFAVTMMMFSC